MLNKYQTNPQSCTDDEYIMIRIKHSEIWLLFELKQRQKKNSEIIHKGKNLKIFQIAGYRK